MVVVFDAGQGIPQAVLDAALALHQRNNTDLTFGPFGNPDETLPECRPLGRYVEGQIEFTNLQARNHAAALAKFQQLMPMGSANVLFDAAYELWRNEIGHPDSASGRLLGFASQNVNVLLEVAQAIRVQQHRTLDVFAFLHLVEASLPHISHFDAADVVELIDAQHDSTKRDMAGGLIYSAIERRLRSEPQISWEIWHITKDKMSDSMQNLYSTALQALLHTDQQRIALEKAREDAENTDPAIARAALWTLGRAIQDHQLKESDLGDCIAVLRSKTSAASAEIQQAAVRAVAHAAMKDERLMSELVRLAAEHDDYTLAVVANFLFMNQQDFPVSSPHFKPLLQSLVRLLPSQKNAIDNFDWVLHKLYATPEHRPLALDFLTHWVIQHGNSSLNDKASIELFDQTFMQIANDKPGFQVVITKWLVAPEKQLAVACAGLISYLDIRGMKSPMFSLEVLDTFNEQDFRFLARRLLGYVISEESLLSLTFSLLATHRAPERTYGWVHALLTEEVGRDYEHATIEALKARLETAITPQKEFLAQMHAVLLQRSTANDHLPRLQELRPPVRLRRAIALNQAREMKRAQDAANEKSVLRSLFTEVPLKAGRGWFSISNNQVGPTQKLQTISHSMSLPKRAFTDPVGYAISGLHYRIAKREDE